MSAAAAIVFWVLLALVVYVYLGYPVCLWLLTRVRSRPIRRADIRPPVTLIISAFNEEAAIGRKLENALGLDYPADRLDVLVVSDGSTDGTDRIVEACRDPRVCLLRLPGRQGKTAGLNLAVAEARGEIVAFSDANILYREDTLRQLVAGFADPEVGCVTGDARYVAHEASAAHRQEAAYWSYEQQIRCLESRLGSTVGGDGAIFAIRKRLYAPLPPDAINDLVVPLQIVARGFRAVFEPAAIGHEESAGRFGGEFRRKRRIVNRSWRGVLSTREVLDPRRVGLFAWQVWSHKVLRWWVLPCLTGAAVASLLAFQRGAVYRAAALGFVLTLLLAGAGAACRTRRGRLAALAQAAFYFYLVNVASVLGILAALRGRVDTVWTPERTERLHGEAGHPARP